MNWYLMFALLCLVTLSACGGDTSDDAAGIEEVSLEDEELVGFWEAQENPMQIEFLSSATEAPFDTPIKVGNIYQSEVIRDRFFWSLRNDGVIDIAVVNLNCGVRPINACPVARRMEITLRGESVNASTWFIEEIDSQTNERIEVFSENYRKRLLDNFTRLEGEIFLRDRPNIAFSSPELLRLENGNVNFRLEYSSDFSDNQQLIDYSGSTDISNDTISLFPIGTDTVTNTEEFFVDGLGFTNLSVDESIDNLQLKMSANDNVILSYSIEREIVLPNDIEIAQVDTSDFVFREDRSIIYEYINEFVAAPTISVGDKYFGRFALDFDAFGQASGELTFDTETTGSMRIAPISDPTQEQIRFFTWSQDENRIIIDVANFGFIEIDFIQTISGGYQVLYTLLENNLDANYFIVDFIPDANPVLSIEELIGRYRVTGTVPNPFNPASYQYDIEFHSDGELSGVFGGFWFEESPGNFLSFECIDRVGLPIEDYADCLASFNDLSVVSFAHLRRFKFLGGENNQFKMIYTADLYTGGDEFIFDVISLVFRFEKVGGSSN